MQEGYVNLNQEEVSQLEESLTQPEAVALNQVSGKNIKSEIHHQVRK
jgi:predicted site-specific integrase-resolvase